MRNNQINSLLPRVFGEAFDSIFDSKLSDFLGTDFAINTPSVNVIELEDKFKIEMAAPGMTKEDFNIEIDDNKLKISSEQESEVKEDSEDRKYLRREFSYKSFVRSFTLPNTVNQEEINANYVDGVLSIDIMKKEEAKEKGPKTIEIS